MAEAGSIEEASGEPSKYPALNEKYLAVRRGLEM